MRIYVFYYIEREFSSRNVSQFSLKLRFVDRPSTNFAPKNSLLATCRQVFRLCGIIAFQLLLAARRRVNHDLLRLNAFFLRFDGFFLPLSRFLLERGFPVGRMPTLIYLVREFRFRSLVSKEMRSDRHGLRLVEECFLRITRGVVFFSRGRERILRERLEP